MNFDAKKFNYSVRGSVLSAYKKGMFLIISSMASSDSQKELLKIDVGAEFSTIIDQAEMHLVGDGFHIDVCFKDEKDIMIKGSNIDIKILYPENQIGYMANFAQKIDNEIYLINYQSQNFNWVTPIKGNICLIAPKTKPGSVKRDFIEIDVNCDSNSFEIIIEQFDTGSYCRHYDNNSYYHSVQKHTLDFKQWVSKFGLQNQIDMEAAYCLWQNICPKYMNLKTEAMVMSKYGMDRVWSWDNAINALALSKAHPEVAFNQFIFPYLYMDENGSVPDCVGLFNNVNLFVKPPIQGWIYKHMMRNSAYFAQKEQIKEIYPYMKKNTEWWINYRGMSPFYLHGNDSGADNATCFDEADMIATGELSAMLSEQCDILKYFAEKLCLYGESHYFNDMSVRYAKTAVSDFYDGDIFYVQKENNKKVYNFSSLLPYRIIVIENKMPSTMKNTILNKLKSEFLSNYGLASEALSSDKFVEDGYWRGAVWAPDQVIFAIALADMGESDMARDIAQKYSEAIAKSGFYENISALDGKGLCCRNHTWTAAGYLIMRDLLMNI